MKRTNQAAFLSLILLGCLSPGSTAQASLFTNGSFESGLSGWTAYNAVGLTSQATDGVLGVTYSSSDNPVSGVIYQTFDTVALQTYTVQFDYGRLTTGGTAEQRLQIEVLDGNGNDPLAELINAGSGTVNTTHGATVLQNTNVLVVRDPNGSNFIPVSSAPNDMFSAWNFTFTAASASSTIVFRDVSTGTINEDGELDNIRIEAVPEPTTLFTGVLSAVACAAIRRRRREAATA